MKNWFEVDRHGLAQILEHKGKEFVLFELIQNGWDEPGVTKVIVLLEHQGRNKAMLVVEDDAPEGFKDLSHAFTLFADSAKKANPEQRGRFNLGEKLVLAISDEVTIRTTKGGIQFDAEGRHSLRNGQPVGSRIECLLRMTPDECRAVEAQARKLISPERITTSSTATIDEAVVRTEGIVPVYATAESTIGCSVFQDGKPARVDLRSLKFEGGLREFFGDWLVREQYGPPVIRDGRKRKRLNVAYWAALIAQILEIHFHVNRGVFMKRIPGGDGTIILGTAKIFELISGVLGKTLKDLPSQELGLSRVQQIVGALRVVGAINDPQDAEVVSEFVRQKLQRMPGATLTSQEVALGFRQYLVSQGLPAWSERVAHRELKGVIGRLLGVRQSGDIKRDGKNKRGFHGLALIAEQGEHV